MSQTRGTTACLPCFHFSFLIYPVCFIKEANRNTLRTERMWVLLEEAEMENWRHPTHNHAEERRLGERARVGIKVTRVGDTGGVSVMMSKEEY